ncbi:MAG: hypothetical protein EZS28_010473 [Streblomastix strix]|uniref:Uncharacterized protein n=1 Tax=Streblomastix strix TaxID=222440 RepID=A0A5J4WG61_9EUKA|nr:MAG: hypothetical protein EZS28_010473 [Streblomastix strix]
MTQQVCNTDASQIQGLERVLYKSQSPHDKSRRNESVRIFERQKEYAIENGKGMKMKREDEAIQDAEAGKKKAVAAVAVAVTASKYKKIGQGKEKRQPHEPIETRTCSKMMNATDKLRKRNRSNLKENNKLRISINTNYYNRKFKKIQKQMKTRLKGVLS